GGGPRGRPRGRALRAGDRMPRRPRRGRPARADGTGPQVRVAGGPAQHHRPAGARARRGEHRPPRHPRAPDAPAGYGRSMNLDRAKAPNPLDFLPAAPAELTVTSEDFTDGGPLPGHCGFGAGNTSPQLSWEGAPESTR